MLGGAGAIRGIIALDTDAVACVTLELMVIWGAKQKLKKL